jgi:MoxR-like ATPase
MLYTQLLRDQLRETLAGATSLSEAADRLAAEEDVFFSRRFLLQRPLLRAILSEEPIVLLIDEIDRADSEFEAFLLEVLSDFQVSVPELGTLRAVQQPTVILTSNNTRELSEALKRRCLYLFVDYPTEEEELQDWARALLALNARSLDRETLDNTLTVLLKHESDVQRARRAIHSTGRGRN